MRSVIFVVFIKSLKGSDGCIITSLWPALIYPSPKMMIGVTEITVIMTIVVKISKHIVETDRHVSKPVDLMETEQNFLASFMSQ